LVALGRIGTFLSSEDLPDSYPIDEASPTAVQVDGDFTWETVYDPNQGQKGGKFGQGGRDSANKKGGSKGSEGNGKPTESKSKRNSKFFSRKQAKEKGSSVLPSSINDVEKVDEKEDDGSQVKEKKEEEKPFELKNLKLVVPQGAFIAIVGRVGCGKVGAQ